MKSCRLHKIGDFKCDEVDKPKPQGKELLLKISSCGLCGSDISRIFSHGSSNGKYPLTIGHEFGGEVVEVGPDADASLVGKLGAIFPLIPCNNCAQCKAQYYAMCEDYDYLGSRTDGGFSEYCIIPSDWNFIEAPATFNKESFSMVEPCTVAQHAVRTALYKNCKSLIVFGAGPIGIMAARWAKMLGFGKVMLVDVVDEKVKFANEHGVYCVNSVKQDLAQSWEDFSNTRLCDAVIEGTGAGVALGSAIEVVKPHGKIVLMGNPVGDTQIKLAQHSGILRKEISISGIWNSYYKGKDIDEWKCTVDEISSGRMEVTDLITHKVTLEEVPNLCKDVYENKVNICKAIYSSNI